MSGPLPLSAMEWQAWQAITGHVIRIEEWAILRAMDAAYVDAAHEMIAEKAQ